MNFWNRHIGDIIRDTVSLTMLEDGAYTRLLDQYYQTERPLPLDRKMIYRLARATSANERKACDFVIETFFRKEEDGFHQKRCDAEIACYQEKQRKAQASANARWAKSETNANADANASSSHDASDMRTHSEGNAHQYPLTNHQEKTTHSGSAGEENAAVTPAGISAVMRRYSIPATPSHPNIIALAQQGISLETVDAACSETREAKPNESIAVNYIVKKLEGWAKQATDVQVRGAQKPSLVRTGSGNKQEALERRNLEIADQLAKEYANGAG